ncbi:MAG: pyruvate formate lyase family protein [bacterium]|nr:pyruvate formate lyase family protein [bacterium]
MLSCDRLDLHRLRQGLERIQKQNSVTVRLDGWFLTQEIRMRRLLELRRQGETFSRGMIQALLFQAVCEELPISIHDGEIFAGTQDDGFARSYALINPEFRVETFAGYCDPMAVYGDITPDPDDGLTEARINEVRDFWSREEYALALNEVYAGTGLETSEVVYFVEQVTGHTIADFRPALKDGLLSLIAQTEQRAATETDADKADFLRAAAVSLRAVVKLAGRYADLAGRMASTADGPRRDELQLIAATCRRVPAEGARNLYEAVQSYILLWQGMVLEQAPNPFAFSAGNLDRVLQPFYEAEPVNRDRAIEITRHLLALFNVGDRNWAISQNIMAGGMDESGRDLTCDMSYILLDAFYLSNYPQPALSVKLHRTSPDELYRSMGRFFFTPGHSTPSLFNDELLFKVLKRKGIEDEDLKDYSIAGCQEPLIMGRESGNTTNSWLNLAKVLELTLNDGCSLISGERIGLGYNELGLNPDNPAENIAALKTAFYHQLDYFMPRLERAANGCTQALSLLPVPFLSSFMGGLDSAIDMRDTLGKGTKYNASGCLIHGLTVAADSFSAIAFLLKMEPDKAPLLPEAMRLDFQGYEELRQLLLAAPKAGNDNETADAEAVELACRVSETVAGLRNPWGNSFLPDWSTPSTHLLYGYWTGATPDGRKARSMLNYGIDPTVGSAVGGLPPRIMSAHKLPFQSMTGGYASHIGLDPGLFAGLDENGKVSVLKEQVIRPLFGFGPGDGAAYYVYFNIDSGDHLRLILSDPDKYCPGGIYIMRIHGTFVNFLDLSPAIQEDIIARLDPQSTRLN